MQLATLEVAKPMDHSIGERREKAPESFQLEFSTLKVELERALGRAQVRLVPNQRQA